MVIKLNIAAVTFTNKAAWNERACWTNLRKRRVERAHCFDLSMLCLRSSVERVQKAPFKKQVFLLDDQDQLALLKRKLTEKQIDGDKGICYALMSIISIGKWHANARSGESTCSRWTRAVICILFWDMLHQKQMKAYNALDFDDLIAMPSFTVENQS